jgi:hypothetical protein
MDLVHISLLIAALWGGLLAGWAGLMAVATEADQREDALRAADTRLVSLVAAGRGQRASQQVA